MTTRKYYFVLGESIPQMTGSDVIYETVSQEVVYNFSVSDNGTFMVALEVIIQKNRTHWR